MSSQPRFDEYEAVALIENYILNYYAPKNRNRIEKFEMLSKKLNVYGRWKYPDRIFDDKYRNINGMEWQTKIIETKHIGDCVSLQKSSKLIGEQYDLLFEDLNKFISKLKEFYKCDFSSIGYRKSDLDKNIELIKRFALEEKEF